MKKFKHIHFIGIKGVAMTALAILAKEQGSKITGSDIAEEFVTDEVLKRNGITWNIGFSEKNLIGQPDLVIITGAHGGMSNPEAQAAKLRGLKTVMHGQALGMFMEGYKQISVAGCHGKTTTAALIATLFEKANLNPSFAVGCSEISCLKTPSKYGKGQYFIAEADEYLTCPETNPLPRFLWQHPDILIITNIEYDHPDAFADLNAIKNAFQKLIEKISANGLLITNIDNKNIKSLLQYAPKLITYGKSPLADWKIKRIYTSMEKTNFWLEYQGREMGCFQLSIPGEHNVFNATAAIITGLEAGIDIEKIRKILPIFTGTKRRFEKIAKLNGILLFDDYAHHPTEIKATLKAAKEWYSGSRIIAVFQPHTYSRTKALLKDFADCFENADYVLIGDIYSSARETETHGTNAKLLVEEIAKNHPRVYYVKDEKGTGDFVRKNAKEGDLIITMGAGNVYKWHKNIIKLLNG